MKSQQYYIPSDENRLQSNRLITLGDLFDFKKQLLSEIRLLLKELHGQPVKRWLKSHEVRRVLNISPSTLQILRRNQTIPYTKIGGVLYYDINNINKLLESYQKTK